ncbi:hypothetical protein POVWA1_077860 [Plasmodium ovale wallikeri]|uniref:Uncharacterized protein n=1 Tax=Plasmodium ovale wallikeri TaxID=864142 RepID=A0A1A9AKT4_PLAOA|nr:hypothetical protein POVWA1_077860 [Plasmodium ovale wallikeri]
MCFHCPTNGCKVCFRFGFIHFKYGGISKHVWKNHKGHTPSSYVHLLQKGKKVQTWLDIDRRMHANHI